MAYLACVDDYAAPWRTTKVLVLVNASPKALASSIDWGIASAALGVVFLILSAVLTPTWLAAVLATFGGSLFTIAVVSFFYDAIGRQALLDDLQKIVDSNMSVVKSGLQWIGESGEVELDKAVADAERVTFLPFDPISWERNVLSDVVRIARRRALQVTVILPEASEPILSMLAARLSRPADELQQELDGAITRLGDTWDAARPAQGSTLTVRRGTVLPSVGLTVTSQRLVIEVGPSLGYVLPDRTTTCMTFGENSDQLRRSIAQLEDAETRTTIVDQRPRQRSRTVEASTGDDRAARSPDQGSAVESGRQADL